MASQTSTTREQELISPESGEHEALVALSRMLGREGATPLRLIASDGSEIELPDSLNRVLQRAAAALADEQSIAVEPFKKYVSIADAARLLNISPAAVVSVIDRNELTAAVIDGQQVLDISDIASWGAQHRARLLKGLEDLTRMSQEMGLYDLDRS